MADTKISSLTSATTPLDGTEVLPIVQSSTTKKVANNDLRPKQIQSNATSGVMQVAGPAAGTTRVMTIPNANFTAARTDAAQTFSGTQTFSGVVAGTGGMAAKQGSTASLGSGGTEDVYTGGSFDSFYVVAHGNVNTTQWSAAIVYIQAGGGVNVAYINAGAIGIGSGGSYTIRLTNSGTTQSIGYTIFYFATAQ